MSAQGDGHRRRLGDRGQIERASICPEPKCGRAGFHDPACPARGTGA